jgi:hypothetical protein
MVCLGWSGSLCRSRNCHLRARSLSCVRNGRSLVGVQVHVYSPPPMLPMSLSCVPSSRSSSSPLGEPDITSSSESILGGEGDGRSETGVPGACRSVLVLRDLTGWTLSSSAISEAFRLLTWEFVVAGRAAASQRDSRLRSERRGCGFEIVLDYQWLVLSVACRVHRRGDSGRRRRSMNVLPDVTGSEE